MNDMDDEEPNETGEDYTCFTLSAQHNSETGSFSDLSKAFKDNPSLEYYLELRRSNPGKLIEIATNWSLDWCFANEERVEALGIDIKDVVGSLDADEASASRLCLQLIELIVERRKREQAGETHLVGRGEAISDSLVNYLIAMMLDALDWNDQMIIPRDLIVLIKHQLGADTSVEDAKMTVNTNRQNARSIGAQLKARGEKVSLGRVAEIMNVERSTVLRWFKNQDFHEEVDWWFEVTKAINVGDWFKKRNDGQDKGD